MGINPLILKQAPPHPKTSKLNKYRWRLVEKIRYHKNLFDRKTLQNADANSEPSQTSKMKFLLKIVA